jgi:hypothetical protein
LTPSKIITDSRNGHLITASPAVIIHHQSQFDSCGASFISNCSRPQFSIANFSGLYELDQMRSFAESSSLIKPMLVQAASEAKLRVDRMRARTELDLDDKR